jgi:adenylosuccinate lyase
VFCPSASLALQAGICLVQVVVRTGVRCLFCAAEATGGQSRLRVPVLCMESVQLRAVSPVDGRYAERTAVLAEYFSEEAYIHYRARVELVYAVALVQAGVVRLSPAVGVLTAEALTHRLLADRLAFAQAAKAYERTTNHDVKALEYALKDRVAQVLTDWPEADRQAFSNAIHLGLTSQDVNNTALPLALREGLEGVLHPHYDRVCRQLWHLGSAWKAVPMLARTHGQPASPTTLGKEILVFAERLGRQLDSLRHLPYPAKFGGATGHFNAHRLAYPNVDWNAFADALVRSLGLVRSYPTTQIEHYDGLAAIFDNLRRANVVLIDLCRDLWAYISLDYFRLRIVRDEVGSSAMPHKVNPIDFENAEGNLGLANALFDFLSNKLPVSRLQRDLTDSTVLRNVGVPLAHTLIALESLHKGLAKLELNGPRLEADLEANWAVLAEAIQLVLKREGIAQGYELLKDLTRTGHALTPQALHAFIDTLPVPADVRAELRTLTPHTYIGYAAE